MNAPASGSFVAPIRVLMVEDVATDAVLEVRELKRAGLRVEHRLVDNEAAFVNALGEFRPSVIISDFSMPHFDGMAALALARESAPQVPFIFVSGTIGEEYAIRALKNGATDYVLKTNLVRLPAAVERALQEARERASRLEAETMFRDVLEFAPDSMVVVNAGGRIVLVNGQCERVFGYARTGLIGQPVEILLPERARGGHVASRRAFMGDSRPRPMGAQLELTARHRDGREIPVEISLAPIGLRREPLVVATIRDQTERRMQERRIARLSRVRDMLGATNGAIVRIRERQALFAELCRIAVAEGGFALARVTERAPDGRARIAATTETDPSLYQRMLDEYNERPAKAQSLVARVLRTGEPIVSNDVAQDVRVTHRVALTEGGTYALALLPLAVEGRLAAVLGLRARDPGAFDHEELRLLREIVSNTEFALELMEKQARLDYLAYYDALTGLPNRMLFRDRLGQAIEAARREGRPLGLAVFDLERFKAIKEAFGEHAGDVALRVIAARMRDAISDVSRIGRLMGDVFAIMFPAIETPADVARATAELGEKLLGPALLLEGREFKLAAKAGIAVYPGDGAEAETLLHNAEAALAKAKQTGERYLFYAPQINARVAEQIDLEQHLRRAVDDGELFLHFQPKVALEGRRIVGVEGLLRWIAPDGTPIPPVRFVPLLEETGLIHEAGKQALAKAAATHRAWRAAGLEAPRIAVNVSAVQLRSAGFVQVLSATLGDGKDSGVDLEVTESLMMADVEASIAKLRQARELGLHISLDDFGTGYSSLAYLARLPVDALKIDRSFIHGITENANDTSLVSTIISLGQAMRLKVIAEGVETEEQARLLRLLRCDQMQGYLFSMPLAAERIVALLGGTANP